MIYSAALPTEVHTNALNHLLQTPGQEDLCFAVWYPSRGRQRMTALVASLILPDEGDRLLHGNASFLPAYFERALGIALDAGGGLAFLHSHLGPGWQGMSPDDVAAELRQAPSVKGATGLPLVGLTLGTDGAWSARFWEKTGPREYERFWCRSVRVVGERLSVTYHDGQAPVPTFRPELARTISAWGSTTQAQLARLKIGVVGTGNVGNIVSEALARMGIGHIKLIDFDTVKTHNLDRLLHATHRDARLHLAKVQVLKRALLESATAAPCIIDSIEWSIAEEEGFRDALDCDVLFSCVDRPWPRYIMNLIAYAHLIPVIDGGIAIETKTGGTGLRRADWRAHVATPTRRCLECLEQYDPGLVQAEREGYFDDPSYIAGLPANHPIRRNENVFAFGLSAASFEVLQFLTMAVFPLGFSNAGAQMYHFVGAILDQHWEECNPNCLFPSLVAKGDSVGFSVTGRHLAAERERTDRAKIHSTWKHRVRRFLPW